MNDNKKLIIQALVVLICLGFILESFAFGSRNTGKNMEAGAETQELTGVAVQNMTIIDYRPYLYTDGLLNESTRAELLAMEGVEEIIDDGAARSIISLSESRKVPEIYSYLKRKNVSSYTLATLAMPAYFGMTLANGSNVNVVGTRFEYMAEPVSPVGGKMLMRLVIQARGEAPIGISGISPLLSSVELETDARISESSGKTFYYSVPWESRDISIAKLEQEFGAGNVDYTRNDNIIFSSPLTTQEMLGKKYDYVETITEMGITAKDGFTDRQRVIADFGEGVEFMNSTLVVHSIADPGLDFPAEEKYVYTVEIPEKLGGYSFYVNSAEVVATGERNGTIPVKITANVLGNTVVEITGVEEKEG